MSCEFSKIMLTGSLIVNGLLIADLLIRMLVKE